MARTAKAFCGGSEHEVLEAIEEENVEWLLAKMEDEDVDVVYDDKRSAVQLYGCEGNLALHVSVSSTLAQALAEASTRF